MKKNNFESLFQETKEAKLEEFNKLLIEKESKASDISFVINKFFEKLNIEFNELLKTNPNPNNNYTDIEDTMKENKDETFNSSLTKFIDSIPLKLREKTVIYLANYYAYLDFFDSLNEKKESYANPEIENGIESSLRQKTFALLFLLEHFKITSSNIDKTTIAKFVRFITGKGHEAKNILNTNTYKHVRSYYLDNINSTNFKKDINEIIKHFENVKLTSIVDLIKQKNDKH